jgi:hypothetical protein
VIRIELVCMSVICLHIKFNIPGSSVLLVRPRNVNVNVKVYCQNFVLLMRKSLKMPRTKNDYFNLPS